MGGVGKVTRSSRLNYYLFIQETYFMMLKGGMGYVSKVTHFSRLNHHPKSGSNVDPKAKQVYVETPLASRHPPTHPPIQLGNKMYITNWSLSLSSIKQRSANPRF